MTKRANNHEADYRLKPNCSHSENDPNCVCPDVQLAQTFVRQAYMNESTVIRIPNFVQTEQSDSPIRLSSTSNSNSVEKEKFDQISTNISAFIQKSCIKMAANQKGPFVSCFEMTKTAKSLFSFCEEATWDSYCNQEVAQAGQVPRENPHTEGRAESQIVPHFQDSQQRTAPEVPVPEVQAEASNADDNVLRRERQPPILCTEDENVIVQSTGQEVQDESLVPNLLPTDEHSYALEEKATNPAETGYSDAQVQVPDDIILAVLDWLHAESESDSASTATKQDDHEVPGIDVTDCVYEPEVATNKGIPVKKPRSSKPLRLGLSRKQKVKQLHRSK